MAKAKDESADVAADPVVVESAAKRFRVRTRGEGGPDQVVAADTVEDAVRAFNGNSTNYPLKQLIVEPA